MPNSPRHLDDLTPDESACLERCASRFERAWRGGERPVLDDYLAGAGPLRRAQLVELVHTDLEYRLKAGEPVRVEDYLLCYTELASDREAVVDLLSAECEWRCRALTGSAEEARRHLAAARDSAIAGEDGASGREQPGQDTRRLGRFVLLDEIGKGSFGTVHKAYDSELRRTVAVKVQRPGGLSDARFLREARNAAALRHPGIVTVHDAGQADGVCYLISEFVAGQTLAQRLAAGRPPLRQAAAWIADVAEALAYAHKHGVIHRDVKPSNILLDVEGRPRLADFGLARHDAADGTATEEGQVLGTPAYMSPEQARGEVKRLDARTDVYSLGVVLYELLTGETPFRGNNRMLLRQVLEDEPRPLRRVNDEVPRDLETVCLKALAKEPAARYAGAAEFGDDLRRFLEAQPVRARPVGMAGRVLRWCRRRPAPAALSAALLLVAAAGVAGVFWQWRQAENHLAEAEYQHDLALANARQAHQAINDFIKVASDPLLEEGAHLGPVRQRLWQTGLKYYGSFLEQAETAPSATDLALRRDTASAQTNLAFLLQQLGYSAKAEAAFAKGRQLWQPLAQEDPRNLSCMLGLARTLYAQGQLWQRQGHAGALDAYRDVIPLVRDFPSPKLLSDSDRSLVLASYVGVGEIREGAGRFAEASECHEQARTCGEDYLRERPDSIVMHHQLLGVYGALARLEQKRDRPDQALRAHRRGVEIGQRLVDLAPNVPGYRLQLIQHCLALGFLHQAAGQNEKALRAYDEADQWLTHILQRDPAHFDARRLRGHDHYCRCQALHGLGRQQEALTSCRRAHGILEQLTRERPANAAVQDLLAQVCFWLGKLHAEAERRMEASAAFEQGADLYAQLARRAPEEPKWRFMQGTCLHSVGNQLRDLGQVGQAAKHFRRAAALRDGACQDAPHNLRWRADSAGTWHNLGEMEERMDHAKEALAAYQRAVEQLRPAAAKDRSQTEHQRRLREFIQDVQRLLMAGPHERGWQRLGPATRSRRGASFVARGYGETLSSSWAQLRPASYEPVHLRTRRAPGGLPNS